MPPTAATCYFRVLAPLRFPVEAAPGQWLSVWSGDPNLLVFAESGEDVVTTGYFPEAKLWTVLADLLDAETIAPLSSAELYRLGHALRGMHSPLRPYLRGLRLA